MGRKTGKKESESTPAMGGLNTYLAIVGKNRQKPWMGKSKEIRGKTRDGFSQTIRR